MIEKNTVLLDLNDYNDLKQVENDYISLKEELEGCLKRLDENGKPAKNEWMLNTTSKIEIDMHKLCEVLDIQGYDIEIIN